MTGFKLYPEERPWWSFQDYQAVLDAMSRIGITAPSVLEFGPGSSTLALIEGGAGRIDACEDDPDWAEVYQRRIVERFPQIVRILPYVWGEEFEVSGVADSYDLALIDGPRGTERRPAVLRYAIRRCRWVLMCCEEHNTRPWLRDDIRSIADDAGRSVEFTVTGPLSGAFALVGPAAC